MYKDGKREENDVWVKEDKVHDGKDRKREREQMEENVKSGTVKKIEAFQYLGITINEEGNSRRTRKVVTRR